MNKTTINIKGRDNNPVDVISPPITDPVQIRAMIKTTARTRGADVKDVLIINSGPDFKTPQVWYIEVYRKEEKDQ